MLIAAPIYAAAQMPITADSTGIGTIIGNPSANTYTVTGGTRCIASGCSTANTTATNLFHSFGTFNVPTGASVLFGGPSGTVNVISRVTGGQASTIDGRISTRTTATGVTPMTSASFYLINPAGVMFGANAAIDVNGSFRVSTADYIALGTANALSTKEAEKATVLSSASPTAFGFLGDSPAGISVNGRLQPVGTGRTISLIGGNVEISGPLTQTQVRAPGGRIEIASVASPGEVMLGTADLGFASFARGGDVNISGGGLVTTQQGGPSGTIVIRSGRLTIDQSTLTVDTLAADGLAVGLNLRANESIVVRNNAMVQSLALASRTGSGISIEAGKLSVTAGGVVQTTGGTANAANGGQIVIAVGSAEIVDGKIRTTSNASPAGNISITASGTVTVAGPNGEISTVKTNANTPTTANPSLAGDISVTAADVFLRDRGKIQSGAQSGPLAGAKVNVTATGTVSIASLAGISSQSSRTSGPITVSAAQLMMDSGFITTSTFGSGTAGTVLISANNVSLANGAQIATSSQLATTGAGGIITINAPGSVTVSGRASGTGVGANEFTGTGSSNSGLFSTAGGSGNAGQIGITTGVLTVGDGGRISVVTRAAGNAGTVLANLDKLVLTGDGRIESSTTSSGAGGAITVNAAGSVEILNGASIRADSTGSGATGNITVSAGDGIFMSGGSISTLAATSDGGNITLMAPRIVRLTDSEITTSVLSGQGGGGNIFIDPEFVILQGSTISANAFGGPGGNITIVADNFLADTTSSLQASSALSTPGTVQIQSPDNNVAGDIAQLPRELVDASQLLRGACSARRVGAPSSFTVAGRGGVPADPDGYLPTFSASSVPFFAQAPVERVEGFALAMAGGDCWR